MVKLVLKHSCFPSRKAFLHCPAIDILSPDLDNVWPLQMLGLVSCCADITSGLAQQTLAFNALTTRQTSQLILCSSD